MSTSRVVSRRACARNASQKGAGICGLFWRWEAIIDSRLPIISLVAPVASSSLRAEAAAAGSTGRLGWSCAEAAETTSTRPQSTVTLARIIATPDEKGGRPASRQGPRPAPRDDHSDDQHANGDTDEPAGDPSQSPGPLGGREPVGLAFERAEHMVEGGQDFAGASARTGGHHLDRFPAQRYLRRINRDSAAALSGVGTDRVDVEAVPLHGHEL